jgi:chemotaxis protein MotB
VISRFCGVPWVLFTPIVGSPKVLAPTPEEAVSVLSKLSIIALTILMFSCGYTEEEWQAQLDKYNKLAAEHQKGEAARQAAQAELDQVRSQVDRLKGELQKMGVNMDTLNEQLQQTGSQNEQLSKNVQEMQRALDEYKARAAQLERIKQRFELLQTKLKKLTELGLKVEIRRNRMVIRLPGDVLFASGEDRLRPEGKNVLNAVADVIRNDKQLIARYFQVAGHTDNKPLAGGRFHDNWGLSTMRAREVLVYLITARDPKDPKKSGGGLDATRLHAAGYGETDPVAKNDSDEGRQQNRRVELVLMPDVEEMLDLRSLL